MSAPTRWITIGALLALAACGGGEAPAPAASGGGAAPGSDLTAFQLEHGIGPVTEPVTLGPIDRGMAAAGQAVFEVKCSACHKMAERYVGPALGEITTQQSPAFILNMILNPQEMVERHPVGKALLAEYMTFMPNQGLTQDEARQVLEYLRTQAKAP